MHRSVDSTGDIKVCQHRTDGPTLDSWVRAAAMPRDRAQRLRNKAMHITIGEVRGRIKPAAVEVLRVLVDGTFPDKMRQAGPLLILRIDHLSVGTIAKRLGWSSIDERDATRLTAEGALTDEDRRSLLSGKRRVDRALAQLIAAGLITRTRRAGGRTITIIELRAPFDGPEGAAGVVAEPPAGTTETSHRGEQPGTTETSQPVRQERRTDHDENVVTGATKTSHPLLSLDPPPVLQPLEPTTNNTVRTVVVGGVSFDIPVEDEEEPPRVPDTDRERIDERRQMLRDAGVRGPMLDELSHRRLSLLAVGCIIAEVEDIGSLDNPPGLIVRQLQATPDDIDDDTPSPRHWRKPANIAEAIEQVEQGRDAAMVFDIMTEGLSTPNLIAWLSEVADDMGLDRLRHPTDKLRVMPEVRRELVGHLIDAWKDRQRRREIFTGGQR